MRRLISKAYTDNIEKYRPVCIDGCHPLTSCTSGSSPLRNTGAIVRSSTGTSVRTGWVTDSCSTEGGVYYYSNCKCLVIT